MDRSSGQNPVGLPEIRLGVPAAGPQESTVAISGFGSLRVRLGRALAPTGARVHSVSNDNEHFYVRVQLKRQRPTTIYLGFDGRWWQGGVSSNENSSEGIFEVDREAALEIARAWSVEAHQRSPLDAGLRYAWSFPTQATPADVMLSIDNTGDTRLCLWHVGFYSFEFDATRDEVAVTTKGPFIYSGPTGLSRIAPGETLALSADLRKWMDLDLPGRYEIRARFSGTLARDGADLLASHLLADEWDVAPAGRGVVLVACSGS
jgi:hypothetical protein